MSVELLLSPLLLQFVSHLVSLLREVVTRWQWRRLTEHVYKIRNNIHSPHAACTHATTIKLVILWPVICKMCQDYYDSCQATVNVDL